ncbi:HNH endonuclease [Streptomyces sp. SID5643]|nr:HNH endonuclease [Streptomyces sp. SID5643]MZF86705.1 HNH endonuclease [Streptomyces sp. SID5643]
MPMPAWTEDALVLAGALVAENGWRELRTGHVDVQELSDLLRSLPVHAPEARALPGFRSPDSVSRKVTDFVTNHPLYSGKVTRCGKPTLCMIEAFIKRETEMLQAAKAIEEGIASGELRHLKEQPDEVDDAGSTAIEGRLLVRRALARERDLRLRALKIKQARLMGGPLRCEVCDFDFAHTYGDLGDGYIEVHHVTPLHATGTRETKLAHLACLCANCHRMCHRSRPGESWRTPAALREHMGKFLPATAHQAASASAS